MTIYLNEKASAWLGRPTWKQESFECERNQLARAMEWAGHPEIAREIRAVFAGSAQVRLLPEPHPGHFFVRPENPDEAAGYAYNLLIFSTHYQPTP